MALDRDANVDGEQMDDLLLRIRQASTNLGQTNTARIMSEISEYEIMMKEFIEDHLAGIYISNMLVVIRSDCPSDFQLGKGFRMIESSIHDDTY